MVIGELSKWGENWQDVQLLDNDLEFLHGIVNVSGVYPGGSINLFGGTVAPVPINTQGDENRQTEGWTQTPLAPTSFHGSSPHNGFGSNGVPARPDNVTTKWALGAWAIRNGANNQFRLEAGLDVNTIRRWWDRGFRTWQLSMWVFVPANTAAIVNQNLGAGQQGAGSPAINLADINTTTNPPDNRIEAQIVATTGGSIIVGSQLVGNYEVGNAGGWQRLTWNWTITPAQRRRLRHYGRRSLQLQLIFSGTGHFRGLIYSPEFRIVG